MLCYGISILKRFLYSLRVTWVVSKVNRAGMDFLKTRPTTIIGASIVFHRYLLNHLPMAILTALLLLIRHKWRENRASSDVS